jgi:hypothetical protein
MRKDVESMNRFELLNEVVRLTQRLERADRVEADNAYLSSENRRLNTELGRLYSQQTIIAQYLDHVGQEKDKAFLLDIADDLRCGRLVGYKFAKRVSKRIVTERRTQAQGRRKTQRRGKGE